MKKLLLSFTLLLTPLLAEVEHLLLDKKILDSKIKIVDIRTPSEWVNTGIIKGSIPIMFFNDQGGYDLESFLKELNSHIDTKKKFALICNTGSRTRILGEYLSQTYGYDIINLRAGILYAISQKLPIEAYKKK